MSTAFTDLARRAFVETLALVGVPIIANGVTKQCVTGPIERKRRQEIVGYVPESTTQVDMLAEDFDALALEEDKSVVTIDGEVLVLGAVYRDAIDPCVHFLVSKDH